MKEDKYYGIKNKYRYVEGMADAIHIKDCVYSAYTMKTYYAEGYSNGVYLNKLLRNINENT